MKLSMKSERCKIIRQYASTYENVCLIYLLLHCLCMETSSESEKYGMQSQVTLKVNFCSKSMKGFILTIDIVVWCVHSLSTSACTRCSTYSSLTCESKMTPSSIHIWLYNGAAVTCLCTDKSSTSFITVMLLLFWHCLYALGSVGFVYLMTTYPVVPQYLYTQNLAIPFPHIILSSLCSAAKSNASQIA